MNDIIHQKEWAQCELGDLLAYIQPTAYIVENTEYDDTYDTPVLTAGKSFIKGYTKETQGIFDEPPVIIFDDFTTATKYVNFPFKVKSSAMKILTPCCSLVNLKYLFYYMQTINIRSDTHKRYWISIYAKENLLLPPENEQNRIVAKIEELFSELDKGVESLKIASDQLKVYRQALLQHAFEGKLTTKWRSANPDKLETSHQLLERIKIERETFFGLQLEEWNASVKRWEKYSKKGKKPNKPRKLKLPGPIDNIELSNLPPLPSNWMWLKLGELTWSVKDGPHYSPKYTQEGIPFISGGNVRPNGIDFKNVKYISNDLNAELCKRCKPEVGDVLYSKGGTTGIARVNTYEHEFNVWVHVAVLKIVESIRPFFLQHALNSPYPYSQSQKYTHGVGNQDLGLTRMVNIILPVCNSLEQHQVIREVDKIASVLDGLESDVVMALKKLTILRQSILTKAFSGNLVAQDPNDEPANDLLKRISKDKVHSTTKAIKKKFVKRKTNS